MLQKFTICTAAIASAFLGIGCAGGGTGSDSYQVNPLGAGPAPVSLSSNSEVIDPTDLGAAGNYVILAKTGVSNTTGSTITGNIGASPVAASYITGFGLTANSSNVFSTSSSVVGKVYAANYAAPTPTRMTSAIGSMQRAYLDAEGRSHPDFNELYSGNIGGKTLAPGLYKWSTGVTIPTDVTLSGAADDVWIFQIAGNLTMSAAKSVLLG
jgi:hypothetical protein